jgi:hypothetical protein
MKKLVLLFSTVVLTANLHAQEANVPNVHKTLIMKLTADWCPPCGASGWTQTETLIDHAKAGSIKAVVIAVHDQSDQTVLNVTSPYGNLISNLDTNVLYIPTWTVGKLNMAQSTIGQIESRVNTVTASAAEANVGFVPTWAADGSSVTVKATTKFFANATGTYSVGVYIVEDKVSAKQASQGTGTWPNSTAVEHHHILRAPASGMTTAFGTQLSGTSFTSGQKIDNTFTFPLKAGWNKANLTAIAVLWKKTGSQWEVANVNDVMTFATGVNNIGDEIVTGVYPNPANDKFNVAIGQSINRCTISLMDMTGKKVAELYNGEVNNNAFGISLNRPADLASGTFLMQISSDKGAQIVKLQLQ